jgi:hypothetical protein
VGSPIEEARDVVVDAAGDVIAAGVLNNRNTESDMAIVKLAGATGAELWRTELTGPANGSDDVANAIDLDSTGDVLVAGQTFRGSPDAAFTVAKLRGSTGSEVWRQDFDGTWFDVDARDAGRALAVDGSDDVIAAGALLNDHALADLDFAVLKLSGLDGVSGPVAGRRLQVSDRAGAPTNRRVFALGRDRTITTAAGGSIGDPTLGGGVLHLVNPTTLETATFALPAAGWTALGTPPGARGYRYADSAGANGPCKTLLVKPGEDPGRLRRRDPVLARRADARDARRLRAARHRCRAMHAVRRHGVARSGDGEPRAERHVRRPERAGVRRRLSVGGRPLQPGTPVAAGERATMSAGVAS